MLRKISIIFLVALLLIFAVSCADDSPEECSSHADGDGDGLCDVCKAQIEVEPPKEENKEISLITEGVSNFKIVIAKSSSTASTNKAVDSLIKKLNSLGITVEKAADDPTTVTECEVIIGSPESRGDAYKRDPHELGPNGYSINLIGGKIQILAGSDASISKAVEVFAEDFLGIKKDTEKLSDVKISAEQNIEEKQTDFRITSLKICGEDMKGFSIATDKGNKYTMPLAEYIQSKIYERSGYWFDIVPLSDAGKSIKIIVEENDGKSDGYSLDVSSSALVVKCQFPDKLEKTFNSYFINKVVNASGDVEFLQEDSKTLDLRRIYYEDFGATNNGEADDDFDAIKETHKYANRWGHTVCAKPGATYYIGNAHAIGATVKTNTEWSTAKFIIDDRSILPKRDDGKYNWEKDTVIFDIRPDVPSTVYTASENNLPFTTLQKSASNIGFAPGFDALIIVTDSTHKAYIRTGANADSGQNLMDTFKVDKDGNISPDTALLWDFDNITEIEVIPANDKPITVSGGFFKRYHNEGPSEYSYYSRNIVCCRSNTLIKGIDYTIVVTKDHGCPYNGFIALEKCDSSSVTDCLLEDPPSFSTKTETSGEDGIAMGSYYLTGHSCTNVSWQRMRAKNFWNETGDYIAPGGGMGTNYCKNVLFADNMLFTFDAHCGSGNITVKNCSLRNINAVGGGKIYVENTDFYCEKQRAMIVLRLDYGSLWMGDVELVDCEVFLPDDANKVGIFRAGREADHDFGYETCMPTTVTLDNLKVHSQTKTIDLVFGDSVINAPLGANVKNPYKPTEKVIVRNCSEGDVIFNFHPESDFFKNLTVEHE